MDKLSLYDVFLRGGPVMWPLLLCSILGAAVILERGLFFLRMGMDTQRFEEGVAAKLRRGDLAGALAMSLASPHPVARVAAVYLRNLLRPADLRTELVRREGSLQIERVEKRLRVLAAISHLAPLLGLLGTVIGMVLAFAKIEGLQGAMKPGDLAGGIWQALLTTVFGLAVAIPCMAAYHGFEGLADKIARRMQFVVTALDEASGTTGGAVADEAARGKTDEDWSVVRA
jgi:biopolymer transport protein ExbB